MSWLSSQGSKFLQAAAPALAFIPGAGPIIAAGAGGLGALLQGGEQERQAGKSLDMQRQAMAQQQQMMQQLMPYYQQLMQETMAGGSMIGHGGYDPYSPMLQEAANQGYRDDTGREMQRAMAASDYHLRPQGGVRSSAMEYARANAIRDASSQNAAFARNLRVQGGVERYNNMQRQSNDRFQRMQALLGGMGNMAGGYGQMGQMYGQMGMQQQGAANDIYGGLGQTIAAMGQAGAFGPKGPRGGQQGKDAGNNYLATNNGAANTAPWGGAAGSAAGGFDPAGLMASYRKLGR